MQGNLCTAIRTTQLSPLSLATDVTDATLGESGLGYEPGQVLVAPPHYLKAFLAAIHGSVYNRSIIFLCHC